MTGCANQATHSLRVRTVPAPAAVADATTAVRLSPLYREAERDCRVHRYLPAADALKRLEATPGLTPQGVAFCREQQVLCLRDAGQPVPASFPAPAFLPVASTATLRPDEADCGPRALSLVCASLHRPCSLPALRRAAGTTAQGTTLAGLAAAAKAVGLKTKGEQVDLPALRRLDRPAVAWVDGNHYLAVLVVDGDTATIHDPNHLREEDIPTTALLARSGGVLLTLTR